MDIRNLEKITKTFYTFNKKQLIVAIQKSAERGVDASRVNLKKLNEDELRSLAITCAVMAHHRRWRGVVSEKATTKRSRHTIDRLIDANEDYVKQAKQRQAAVAKQKPMKNPLEPVISNLEGLVATD